MNRFVKFRRGDSYENLHGEDIAGTEKVEMDITDMYREIDKDQKNENNSTVVSNVPAAKPPSTETYTIQEAIDYIGFGKFQVKLSILTGFAWMADAMEMMILSILSPALHCEWQLKGIQEASITTVVFCGMMLSSSLWGSICDKYGRKRELILCSVFTCYFGILSAFSPNFYWMLILRGLVGFGIGGAPQSVTLYAEFLPSKSRARCVVLVEVFWAFGACFEVLLALVVMPNYGWSTLLGLSALPLVIFSLCCFWLPESARYDMTKGDYEKAVATINRIAEENGKPAPPGRLVEPKAEEITRGAYKDLFAPDLKVTTILLWIIWLVCAFSYYGIVLLTTALFENPDGCHGTDVKTNPEPKCFLECKTLTTDDYRDLTWTTFAEFPGLFVTVFIIDYFGRKKTMAFQFFVFTVFVLLVNICTKRVWLTLFLFIARAFISGAFQAAYVYTPEIYPTSMRALGLGACSGMARIGAIITPFIAQVLLKKSSYLSISIYGCMCLIATIAAWMLPIETKGREMQDVGQGKKKVESKDNS